MTQLRWLGGCIACILACSTPAWADVDMTGFWNANVFGNSTCVQFVQVGSALTMRFCLYYGEDFTGTIDPMTGAFSVNRTPMCNPGAYCHGLSGTASLDSQTFAGTVSCQLYTFSTPCGPYTEPISGARVVCGDGNLTVGPEECDDGNALSGDCCSPTCHVDANGTACDDGNPSTNAERCLAGICADPGDEFQINTETSSGQNAASLSCDATGAFVAVWHGIYSADGISGQRYDSTGTRIGTEFQIATDSPRYPAVAMNAGGDFVVAWTKTLDPPSGVPMGVFARRYDSAGNPGSEFQVSTAATTVGLRPEVSLNDDGAFVVVWTGASDGSAEGIFAQRYDSAGAPLGSEFLLNNSTAGLQYQPAVLMADDGSFVAVWNGDTDGDSHGVFARRFDSTGAPIANAFVVNTSTAALQGPADIAGDATGDFVIVWADGLAVRARQFNASGSPLGGEILVQPSVGSGTIGRPAVATDSAGAFVVTWQSNDPQEVFARKYLSNGTAEGSEFQVNVFTTFAQRAPDVCRGPSDQFVIAWESENEDGSDLGVFGRRFAPPIVEPIDHFKCYQGKDLRTPPFVNVTATTSDQITSESVLAHKLKYLCAPVDKNGEGILDAATHLACYQTVGSLLSPRPGVEVSTQFQTTRFELKNPKLLCLRATKTLLP